MLWRSESSRVCRCPSRCFAFLFTITFDLFSFPLLFLFLAFYLLPLDLLNSISEDSLDRPDFVPTDITERFCEQFYLLRSASTLSLSFRWQLVCWPWQHSLSKIFLWYSPEVTQNVRPEPVHTVSTANPSKSTSGNGLSRGLISPTPNSPSVFAPHTHTSPASVSAYPRSFPNTSYTNLLDCLEKEVGVALIPKTLVPHT